MRSLISVLLLAFALVLGVQAQAQLTIFDLPPCGLTCVLQTLPISGCALTDNDCICKSQKVKKPTADCLQKNCTMAEMLTVAKIQATVCQLPTADEGYKIKVMALTLDVFCAIVTFLRFLGKRLSGQRLTWDDYILALVVVLLIPNVYFVISMVNTGFGKHIYQLGQGDLTMILKCFWIGALLYVVNLGLIKLAMVIFYLRLFPYDRFRFAAWASLGFVILTMLAIFFTAVFQCNPVPLYWNKDLKGQCLNINALAYAGGAVSIVTDVLIVALPIPVISKLRLGWKKKIGVVFMFAVGSFGCIVSMIRLKALVSYGDTVDPTFDLVPAVMWSAIEVSTGQVCASFPALRRLIAVMFPNTFGTTAASSSNEASKPSKGRAQSWYATSNSFGAGSTSVQVEANGKGSSPLTEEHELEGRGWSINKTTEIGLAVGGIGDGVQREKNGGNVVPVRLDSGVNSIKTSNQSETDLRRSNTADSIRPLVLQDVGRIGNLTPEPVYTPSRPTSVPPNDENFSGDRRSRRLSRLGLGWMNGDQSRSRSRTKEVETIEEAENSRGRLSFTRDTETPGTEVTAWYDSDSRSR